jgi:hypothetical protein
MNIAPCLQVISGVVAQPEWVVCSSRHDSWNEPDHLAGAGRRQPCPIGVCVACGRVGDRTAETPARVADPERGRCSR